MLLLLLWTVLAAPAAPTVTIDPPGRIVGVVSDPQGLALPGTLVTARGGDGGEPRQATSDGHGRYRLEAVPCGRYEVTFRLPSFASVVERDLHVQAATTQVVNATLVLHMTAEVLVTDSATFRDLATLESTDTLLGVADSASSGIVTAGQLEARPLLRSTDLIERVPGVVVSQHSSDGKANQYYVRGFNIDHGTDLAVSVAGVPVNMPSHAHGQGYADLGFLIPELVSGIQYRKGTHHADAGDFSAAGSVQFHYVNTLARPLLEVEAGPHRYGRILAAASAPVAGGQVLGAAEAAHDDGPWEVPERFRRLNALVRYSRGTPAAGFQATALVHDARWRGTDQVPARAVAAGALSRWGSLDATDGGTSHRSSLSCEWQRIGGGSATRLQAYAIDYGLDLYSNFTYFLDDPVRGDQFEQEDRRRVYGGHASRQRLWRAGRADAETRFGLQWRHDDVGTLGLHHTSARRRLQTVRQDAVDQTSLAAYADSTLQWTPRLRTSVGLRGDAYRFLVASDHPANGGRSSAGRLSPKLGAVFGPWNGTELYANAGAGFHSNDARGTVTTVDPRTFEPVLPADALAAAYGAEIGVRTLALRGVHATATLWTLGLGSELVFIGDAGGTRQGPPSRRTGVETTVAGSAGPVTIDATVALSRARFVGNGPAGDRVPGAVAGVASLGASLDAARWRASLRLRWLGPRPLTEDGAIVSAASTLANAQVGYRWSRFRLHLELLNAFDARANDVEYFYTSRLPGEPEGGIEDRHVHPSAPRTLRVGLVTTF